MTMENDLILKNFDEGSDGMLPTTSCSLPSSSGISSMKHHARDKTYEYTITFLKYGKIKTMTLEAESREDARLLFQSRIAEMQAFTESGTDPFTILSIR
jgi:hypothetical protein